MAMNTSVHQRLLHLVQQRQAAQTPQSQQQQPLPPQVQQLHQLTLHPQLLRSQQHYPQQVPSHLLPAPQPLLLPSAPQQQLFHQPLPQTIVQPQLVQQPLVNPDHQRLPDALLAEFNNMKRQIAELQAAIPTRPPDDSSPADRPRNSQPEVNGSAGPAAPSAPLQQQQLRLEPDRILPHRNGRLSTDPSPTGTPAALGSRAASSASSAAFSIFEALAVGDWRYVFQQMLEVESMAALKQGAELYFSEQKAYSADHVHNLMTALELFRRCSTTSTDHFTLAAKLFEVVLARLPLLPPDAQSQYFASLEKFAFEAGRFVPWGLVPPKTLALSRRYPPKNGLLRVLEVIISPSTFQSTTYVLELLFDMSTEDITFLKEDSTHDTLLRFYRIADKSQSPVVPSFISKTSINGCDVKYPEPFNEGTGWTQGVLPCKEHLVVGANVISFVVEEKDSVDTDIVVELDKVAFIKPQQAFHEAVSRASPYESVRKIIAARKSKGSTRHSLVCPMSQNRIKYAVRSTSCLHLRCFDLQTWLQRQLDRPNWTCPHCKSFVSCDKLFLDQYTQSILNEAPRDVCYFDVDDNGSWKPVPSVTSSSSVIDLTGEEASASVLSSDEQRHSQLGEIPSSSNSAKRGMSNEEDISTSKRQKPLESDVTASSSTTLRQEQAVVGASSSGVDQNSSKTPNIVTSSKTLFEGHSPEFRENGIQPTSADPGQSQENSSRSSDSLKSLPTSPKPTPLSRTPSVLTAMRNDEQPATRPVTATERIMQSETAAEPGRDRSPGSDASDTVVAANTAANQKKRKNKPLLTAPDLSRIISGWASAISVPEKTTETGNTERAPKSVPLNEEVQTDTLTFTRDTSDENHTANNSPPSIIPEPETVEPQSDNLSPSEREMAYLAELEGDPEWV